MKETLLIDINYFNEQLIYKKNGYSITITPIHPVNDDRNLTVKYFKQIGLVQSRLPKCIEIETYKFQNTELLEKHIIKRLKELLE